MVGWGLVCIATNYTHSGGVPIGSPGTSSEIGASQANVLRARRLVEILRGLGSVDMNRVALHGHSLGAFVTEATAGAYPTLFRAASHTAGGIAPDFIPDIISGLAPTEAQIAGIRAPYQMHHGDRDFVVPVVADQLFDAALRARGVTRQLADLSRRRPRRCALRSGGAGPDSSVVPQQRRPLTEKTRQTRLLKDRQQSEHHADGREFAVRCDGQLLAGERRGG